MSHPLDGCWAKIERANENIRNLDGEIGRFLHAPQCPYRVVGHQNREAGFVNIRVYGTEPPLRLSVLAGEIVYQLRSSLDHLMWALTWQAGGITEGDRIEFPIYADPEQYEAAVSGGMVKGVQHPARKIVDSVQPHRQAEPRNSPLYILDKLCNDDRHRLLTVAITSVTVLDGQKLGIKRTGGEGEDKVVGISPPQKVRATEEGETILTVLFEAPIVGDYEANLEVVPEIAFDEFGLLKLKPLAPSLTHLADYTAQTIKLFDGQF